MIARIWHGETPASKAGEYLEFTEQRAIPDHESVEGNRAAYLLRRIEGDEAHFFTLTFWESETAIEAFVGPDIEIAKYYPERRLPAGVRTDGQTLRCVSGNVATLLKR
ncbi:MULTISPECIES: antibiotic biosynthesis monooxygenase family protein [Natrialbaceae]|uniref:antibiotic biosynthesis monooxygenase family protein n=1 Tax=Natrialbaceae TaxID=1644061 RepID=UPI00207C8B4A|nr:antibiotic biosynthesis monooxygenase [Natronococcus sp. CG52]